MHGCKKKLNKKVIYVKKLQ